MNSMKVWTIGLVMSVVAGLPVTVLTQDNSCGIPPNGNPPIDFSCKDKKDGNYRNPNDCCSYIACSSGHKHIMPCPNGLHWDWHSAEAPAKCDDQYQGQCLGQYTYPAEAACGLK